MGIFLSLGYCLIFVRCSLLWFLAARVFAAFGGEEGSALAGQCSALPGRQEAAAGKGQNCFPTLFSRCAAFSLSSVFGVFLFLGLRRFFFRANPSEAQAFCFAADVFFVVSSILFSLVVSWRVCVFLVARAFAAFRKKPAARQAFCFAGNVCLESVLVFFELFDGLLFRFFAVFAASGKGGERDF